MCSRVCTRIGSLTATSCEKGPKGLDVRQGSENLICMFAVCRPLSEKGEVLGTRGLLILCPLATPYSRFGKRTSTV
jgi:hypothetical protein